MDETTEIYFPTVLELEVGDPGIRSLSLPDAAKERPACDRLLPLACECPVSPTSLHSFPSVYALSKFLLFITTSVVLD
jgi:hypothetical protein